MFCVLTKKFDKFTGPDLHLNSRNTIRQKRRQNRRQEVLLTLVYKSTRQNQKIPSNFFWSSDFGKQTNKKFEFAKRLRNKFLCFISCFKIVIHVEPLKKLKIFFGFLSKKCPKKLGSLPSTFSDFRTRISEFKALSLPSRPPSFWYSKRAWTAYLSCEPGRVCIGTGPIQNNLLQV